MGSQKPIASARRWLLANHLKLIRELDTFRNDRVVSDAQAQGIWPTGYYQAVENPNHWACGAGCAGGMYTDVHCFCACQCLSGVPHLKERDGPCADSVAGAGASESASLATMDLASTTALVRLIWDHLLWPAIAPERPAPMLAHRSQPFASNTTLGCN